MLKSVVGCGDGRRRHIIAAGAARPQVRLHCHGSCIWPQHGIPDMPNLACYDHACGGNSVRESCLS